MSGRGTGWPAPWPLDRLISRLEQGSTLFELVGPKQKGRAHDIREITLEDMTHDVLSEEFGSRSVIMRKPIGTTLGLGVEQFPGRSLPDIVINVAGRFHICELKSSRQDYSRFDNVFSNQSFREYLRSLGHSGGPPWEVEQDIIKLHLYQGMTDTVGSCLFLMVDAYSGYGRSWTKCFRNKDEFLVTMQTDLVRSWADTILDRTQIVDVRGDQATARFIAFELQDIDK